MDQIIEGKVFIDNKIEKCCIGISNGKIINIKKNLHGDSHLIFPNKLILPAGIDIHVHFRDPGFTKKEDFHTGSIAAAYGGISCICDMPNTKPFTSTLNTIKDKHRIAEKKSVIDFGLYAGINAESQPDFSLINEYCCGYKLFLGSTTETTSNQLNQMSTLFSKLKESKKILAVHAEDNQCLQAHAGKERSLQDHQNHRPVECEIKAIQQLINTHARILIPLHICHVSSADAMILLKKRHGSISVGVTPHHLFFNSNSDATIPSYLKVNPPLRNKEDAGYLWNAVKHGDIDVIESDHAPHTVLEKTQDFEEAPSGIPGVETMFPILLAAAKQGDITLSQVIHSVCRRPGEIVGVPKGKISVGYDADFCIVDYDNISRISTDKLHSKCNWTPFENFNAIFPSDVILRGKPIIKDYKMIAASGEGKNIHIQGA